MVSSALSSLPSPLSIHLHLFPTSLTFHPSFSHNAHLPVISPVITPTCHEADGVLGVFGFDHGAAPELPQYSVDELSGVPDPSVQVGREEGLEALEIDLIGSLREGEKRDSRPSRSVQDNHPPFPSLPCQSTPCAPAGAPCESPQTQS